MKLTILVLKLTIFVTYVVGYQDWFFTVRGKETFKVLLGGPLMVHKLWTKLVETKKSSLHGTHKLIRHKHKGRRRIAIVQTIIINTIHIINQSQGLPNTELDTPNTF